MMYTITYSSEDVASGDDLTLSEVGRSELPLLVEVQGRDIHTTVIVKGKLIMRSFSMRAIENNN